MPGKDGTGPMGQGSMSGKGFGFCRFTNFSRGSYFRRGICNLFNRPYLNEKQDLKNYISNLEEELKAAREELNKTKSE